MADPPPYPKSSDTSVASDRGSTTGMPRWVTTIPPPHVRAHEACPRRRRSDQPPSRNADVAMDLTTGFVIVPSRLSITWGVFRDALSAI
jgi:hypothetical protein